MSDYDILGNIAIIKGENKTKKEKIAEAKELLGELKGMKRRKIRVVYFSFSEDSKNDEDKCDLYGAVVALPDFSSLAAIMGLLFFEVDGLTSVLRYWLVGAGFRDQRVGARLIRSYFASCPAVKRFTLWVRSDNETALAKYRNYGYAADGLVDQVVIRRQTTAAGAGPGTTAKGGSLGQN